MTAPTLSFAARCGRALSALALLLAPLFAAASPVEWKLSGVTFDDGGTAAGTFVFDVDTNKIISYNVAVSGGNTTTFPAIMYAASSAVPTSFNIAGASSIAANQKQGTRFLLLVTKTKLTNAGGSVELDPTRSHECYNCAPFRTVSGTLVGTPVTGAPIVPGMSGNWYDPAQNGHGLQLEYLDGGIVTGFWFTFDNAGNQSWINGVGSVEGNKVVMQAGRVLNGKFPPFFDPAQTTKPVWGTLTFTFSDCDHATLTWSASDPDFTPTGTMPLTRLTKIDTTTCP